MGYPVFGEDFFDLGIQLLTLLTAGIVSHSDPAKGINCPFKGFIGLQPHNNLQIPINITGWEGSDRLDCIGIYFIDTTPFVLFSQKFPALFPESLCTLSGSC